MTNISFFPDLSLDMMTLNPIPGLEQVLLLGSVISDWMKPREESGPAGRAGCWVGGLAKASGASLVLWSSLCVDHTGPLQGSSWRRN